jgi:hypothetical protein
VEILRAKIAGDNLKAARLALLSAEQQEQLAKVRFDSGLADFTEYQNAENVTGFLRVELKALGLPGKASAWVEDFFQHNYQDITWRESIEWGEPATAGEGNISIRYKYRATIRGQETITNNQVFTFDSEGKFVSVKDLKDESKNLPEAAVERREVNKNVKDFPEKLDLSTPESACAAWQRACARNDPQAICNLSWRKLDPQQEEKWWQENRERDPEGTAVYIKALADSKVLEVATYRGDLAQVITFLPFPEGKGSDPYSARSFGRINGQWKNLGEDRLPTLEAARQNFENKKDNLWRGFEALRKEKTGAAGAPPAPADAAPKTEKGK